MRDPIGIFSSVSPSPLSLSLSFIFSRDVREGDGFSGRRNRTSRGSRRVSKTKASVLLSFGSESEVTSEIAVAALRIEKELDFDGE